MNKTKRVNGKFEKKPVVLQCTETNNWNVGKNYYQEYPTAALAAGLNDEKAIKAYNESYEEFKGLNLDRLTETPTGEFKYTGEDKKLFYHRDKNRLLFLGFESKLRRLYMDEGDIMKALAKMKDPLPKKENPFKKEHTS